MSGKAVALLGLENFILFQKVDSHKKGSHQHKFDFSLYWYFLAPVQYRGMVRARDRIVKLKNNPNIDF